ncbi:MAG TPA: hypothetical protein VIY26_06965 [Acidimicrobiales bacterium]
MSPGQNAPDFPASEVDLDVSWLVPADLSAVDALARLHLTAARCGRSLHLHGACGGLSELLDFCGLGDVLNVCGCAGQPARERQ